MSRDNFPYGHVFHKMGDDGFYFTRDMLSNWTIRELLLKHYYLTMRLDGYGHLDASDFQKQNCLTFRDELRARNVDAVGNVINNAMWYNWGYRDVGTKWWPLKTREDDYEG